MNEAIDLVLDNKSLRDEFSMRGLDLSQVFFDIPDDLARENRCLHDLLDWVQYYDQCGNDRAKMEKAGYLFPPVDPDVSPENDWFLFERWIKGLPVRATVNSQLDYKYVPKNLETLNREQVCREIDTLTRMLQKIGIEPGFCDDVPPELVYKRLVELLEETFEITCEGVWVIDGCGGCCPYCFQRPWCEFGTESCWPEDEKAGKMYLIKEVQKYVSAGPCSIDILRVFQEKEDREYEEFCKKTEGDELPF